MEIGGGLIAEVVVELGGSGEKKNRSGIRIGKPADWTNVAIHLLFPPWS